MSLLMDALRKAEESKKKAESPDRSNNESPVIEEPAPVQQVAGKPEPPAVSVQPAATEVENGQENQVEAKTVAEPAVYRSPIPDTPLQFRDDEPESDSTQTSDDNEQAAAPQHSTIQQASSHKLELEPRESTSDRKPIIDPEPDDIDTEPVSSEQTAAVSRESESPAPTALELAPDEDDNDKQEAGAGLEIQPPPVVAPKRSAIRERTAASRASARSVFAAKQTGSKKRQQRLLMAAGAVVVVLLLGLVGMRVLMPGSSSGITIPEGYVAGGGSMTAGGQVQRQPVDEPLDEEPELAEEQDTAASTTEDSAVAVSQTTFFAPEQVPVLTAAAELVSEPEATDDSADVQTDTAAALVSQVEDTVANTENQPQVASAPEAPAPAPAVQPEETVDLISFSRRQPVSTIEPLLNSAYEAWQSGNFSLARQRYQAVLDESPLHRDALLGLAAIAVNEDQPGVAMELYSRLLARNPADPVARAGLLELSPAGGPAQQERELRRLLEQHPDVAPLAYALGNVYASRQQWSDAQQQYFRALQLAKTNSRVEGDINPDYAFNLAVSLEHLNQPRAALSFYQEALEQSRLHPASFNETSVRSRVESLSRTLSP